MNLIIDAGNTRVKCAVFEEGELIHNEIFTSILELKDVQSILKNYLCEQVIISSVSDIKKEIIFYLNSKMKVILLNSDTKVPFINDYSTPKTLGVDRIALVASAISSFPMKPVLIIDAGTCITYDFVTENSHYMGGAISPGISMRYKSLNKYTKKLPLLEPKNNVNLIGNSTESSIHSGVVNGVLNEIQSTINTYKKKNRNLTVVLTGGDVNFLSNKLKNGIFANPNFLLEGLNTILTYNLL